MKVMTIMKYIYNHMLAPYDIYSFNLCSIVVVVELTYG